MKGIKSIKEMKKFIYLDNNRDLALAAIFIIYIAMNAETPNSLANILDSIPGYFVVAIFLLTLMMNSPPLVAVLGMVACYELIRRSSNTSDKGLVKNLVPSESKKDEDYKEFNEFPKTLEEEIVSKMAPIESSGSASDADYKPVLDNMNGAAPINYDGVI